MWLLTFINPNQSEAYISKSKVYLELWVNMNIGHMTTITVTTTEIMCKQSTNITKQSTEWGSEKFLESFGCFGSEYPLIVYEAT